MTGAVEFWSSTECGAFQNALLGELTKLGWNAQQRYSVGQDDYRHARSPGARLALRLRAYGLYPGRLAARFLRAQPGVIGVVCTNTFYAPWLAVKTARRGVAVVHWVFDLFPDALIAAGQLVAGSWRERRLRALMRSTFDGAAANVFLGERLRSEAEQRFGRIPRACVIPVGADGGPFRERPPQSRSSDRAATTEILYSGNLGRLHDVDTLIGALAEPIPASLRIKFYGNGAGYRALREAPSLRAQGHQVEFGENLPGPQWVEAMLAADVALVTMRPGAEALVMPSKTYSAMMAGQALLAVCPAHSDLAELVRAHEAGWVVSPGDAIGLRRVLTTIATSPGEVRAKRDNAWQAGHRQYDQCVLAPKWSELLQTLSPAITTPTAVSVR